MTFSYSVWTGSEPALHTEMERWSWFDMAVPLCDRLSANVVGTLICLYQVGLCALWIILGTVCTFPEFTEKNTSRGQKGNERWKGWEILKAKRVWHPILPENQWSSKQCPLHLVNLTFGLHKDNAAIESLGSVPFSDISWFFMCIYMCNYLFVSATEVYVCFTLSELFDCGRCEANCNQTQGEMLLRRGCLKTTHLGFSIHLPCYFPCTLHFHLSDLLWA